MQLARYYGRVLLRALGDTRHFVVEYIRVEAFLAVITIPVQIGLHVPDSRAEGFRALVLVPSLVFLVIAALVFIWNLFWAPVHLSNDASVEIALLGRQIATEKDRERQQRKEQKEHLRRQAQHDAEVRRLLDLYEEGKRLMDDLALNWRGASWGTPIMERDRWRARVTDEIQKTFPVDAVTWDADHHLMTDGITWDGQTYEGDQGRLVHQWAWLLQKLREIMSKAHNRWVS